MPNSGLIRSGVSGDSTKAARIRTVAVARSRSDLRIAATSPQRWQLRTAAVLRGLFSAGELADQARAAGGDVTDDDLKLFIQRDCQAVSSARGPTAVATDPRPPH